MSRLFRAGFLMGLLALALGCGSQAPGGCQGFSPSIAPQVVGKSAPDFTLPTLADPAQKTTLSEVAAEAPVLLAFWATWCPSCVQEVPILNTWHERYGASLRILAVNVAEPRGRVLEFQKRHPMTYPVLMDEDGSVADRFGLVGLPASLMLAKGGEIIYYGFGLPDPIDELINKGD